MYDIFSFGDQFAIEPAEWYPINNNLTNKKKIAVQNMNETRNAYGKVAENLNGDSESLILRTRFQYAYMPPEQDQLQHIFYRGKWYEISEVRPHELGTMGYFRPKEYFLVLIEVNYGPDFVRAN